MRIYANCSCKLSTLCVCVCSVRVLSITCCSCCCCFSICAFPALHSPPLRCCFSSFLYLHALIAVIENVRLLWRPQSANPRSICQPPDLPPLTLCAPQLATPTSLVANFLAHCSLNMNYWFDSSSLSLFWLCPHNPCCPPFITPHWPLSPSQSLTLSLSVSPLICRLYIFNLISVARLKHFLSQIFLSFATSRSSSLSPSVPWPVCLPLCLSVSFLGDRRMERGIYDKLTFLKCMLRQLIIDVDGRTGWAAGERWLKASSNLSVCRWHWRWR